MKQIPDGTSAERRYRTERWHTAAAIGNSGVHAVSTPAILGFIEQTALEAIEPYQDPDEISVGTRIELDHVGAAIAGDEIRCRATVASVERRRITFDIEVRQGTTAVARGRYTRAVLSAERFNAGARGPASAPAVPPAPITCYFDFHSPWSYLAVLSLPRIAARHGRTIRWVPVHVARLIEAIGGRRPLEESEAFVRWYRQDLQHWAARAGVKISYHPAFPLRPGRALRAADRAVELGRGHPFILAVMRAYWTESRDISSLDVLAEIAEASGIDAWEPRRAATDETRKARIAANTREAIAAGVFGVPTMIVDGRLYFGNDRIELLDEHLSVGNRIS